jgi:Putative prokaryotic signal transducing protein
MGQLQACREIRFRPRRKSFSIACGIVRELLRTNDAVLVSAIGALLDSAGIPHVVLDQNMSILEGSLGILPRRLLVPAAHDRAARRLLEDAGYAHELRSPSE